MNFRIFRSLALVALLAGCSTQNDNAGAAADTDQNVLTGGPITGTTLKDLPQPVKDMLKQRTPHAEIADIDKITRDGKVLYEVSFSAPGKNPRLTLREDGTVYAGTVQSTK